MIVDLALRYRLAPQVDVRTERFGGLAYRHDNRKLCILNSRVLVDAIAALENGKSLDEMLAAISRTPEGPSIDRQALAGAMVQLEEKGIVVQMPTTPPATGQVSGTASRQSGGVTSQSRREPKLPAAPRQNAVLHMGLEAPICLTWEITFGCNLRCRHCLSHSGRRRSGELTTDEARRLIDEWAAMKVFYINVGGGEPMRRPDFFTLMDYALDQRIGVKFSTNGILIDEPAADWIASREYLDLQISIDGADAESNDSVRGSGSYDRARKAMERLAVRGCSFKISTVLTRQNCSQLDHLYAMAVSYGAQLRVTRLRPAGRGRGVWEAWRPTAVQNAILYRWLLAHPDVLTGDSFFHLSALGQPLEGLNMCGASTTICCVSPTGDVYACPFAQLPAFRLGNVKRDPGGFAGIWRARQPFGNLRQARSGGACRTCADYAACHGGCPAVKSATGIPVDCPDPDCVRGSGALA